MYLEREVDVLLLERVEDGAEALGEIVETLLSVFLVGRREGVDRVPNGGPGEAVDDSGESGLLGRGVDEPPAGLGRVDHLLGGTLADALGVAVAPDVGR